MIERWKHELFLADEEIKRVDRQYFRTRRGHLGYKQLYFEKMSENRARLRAAAYLVVILVTDNNHAFDS